MKDLYATMALNPEASAADIAAAGEAAPEANAGALILANETKRAAYDRAYSTLKSIGVLRHRMGLDSGDSWFLTNYPDFAPKFRSVAAGKPKADPVKTALPDPAYAEKNQQAGASEAVQVKPPANAKRLVPVMVGAAFVILLIVLVMFL